MVTAFFTLLPVCFKHPILQSLRITDMKVRCLYAENMNLRRKDEKKYRNKFFDNEVVKTFVIQMFYCPMTYLASNNVLNISIYDLYTLKVGSCPNDDNFV